jgi:nucleotide-binding universal stress UspA family protein
MERSREMSGIVVGVDGSPHSERALVWALNEAAIRQVPLTVLAVHQAVVGYWGAAVAYPGCSARPYASLETRFRKTKRISFFETAFSVSMALS